MLERLGEIALGGGSSDTQVIAAGKVIMEQAYGKLAAEHADAPGALERLDAMIARMDDGGEDEEEPDG